MPRRARIDIPNYWYHLISRGQRKNPIFFSNNDMEKYLSILKELLQKYDIILGAFCLMRNHVHLLVFRRNDTLYKFMHQLNTRYAHYFNKKYDLVGHVFQGRYVSRIVLEPRYLNYLVYYIHNNPKKAGIIKENEFYKFSSEEFYKENKSVFDLPLTKVPTWSESEKFNEEESNFIHENYIGTTDMYTLIEKRKPGREKEKFVEKRKKRNILDELKKLHKYSESELAEIKSHKKNRKISRMRKELVRFLYKKNFTISEIARFLNRNISTIYEYIEKTKGR